MGAGIAASSLLRTSASKAADGSAAGNETKTRPTDSPAKSALDPDTTRTILDEVGRLHGRVSPETFAAWKRQLNKSRLIEAAAPRNSALLHILVGEYLLAENGGNEPVQAGWHFRRAKQLVGVRDRLHGWAAYNEALGLYYEGGYGDSTTAFHELLHHQPALSGFDRRRAALWLRHAGACEADHARLDDLGIRRPLRLDPLCGVAGLCMSLKALKLPGSDKKTVMANTHITGRGTSAQDLLDACAKLGGGMASGRMLTADEEGLRHLPMPLIASVMRDHFVTLVEANRDGVTYLCTDCGAWPGGRNKLTWEQWRALKPGVYLSVTKRGSLPDKVLAALVDNAAETKRQTGLTTSGIPGIQVAMNPLREGQSLGSSLIPLSSMFQQLQGHIQALLTLPTTVTCGYSPDSTQCAGCVVCCQTAGVGPGGGGGGGGGPVVGDPVNLATLQEEYTPPADLTVYNPNGPSVVWSRLYNSLRGSSATSYQSDDYGYGWSHSYNVGVYDPSPSAFAVTPSEVPQGGSSTTIPVTGMIAPAAGANAWEIYLDGTLIAYSTTGGPTGGGIPLGGGGGSLPASTENGWNVPVASGTTLTALTIYVPATATISTGYTVRVAYSTGPGGPIPFGCDASAPAAPAGEIQTATSYASAPFSVVVPRVPGIGTKYVIFPNGARVSFSNSALPTTSSPTVVCTVQAGAPLLVDLCYSASDATDYYVVTFADQTRWTTAGGCLNSATLYYPIGSLSDRVGNTIDFVYSGTVGASSALPVLNSINDAVTGNPLLTFNRTSAGNSTITSIADCYGRSMYYTTTLDATSGVPAGYPQGEYGLTLVSQIVTTGTTSPPMRYTYGYSLVNNGEGSEQVPFMTSITVPSPTGSGTSTATIAYQANTGFVSSITDGNGNVTSFTPCTSSGATSTAGAPASGILASGYVLVTTKDPLGNTVYSYIGGFDGNMSGKSITDGAGVATSTKTFSDPNTPYRPSSVQDGNGRTTSYTWDQYGNILTETSPRGTITTRTYDYTHFALGRQTQVVEGNKGSISYTFYEPSGLIASITTPTPGSVGTGAGSSVVEYAHTYSALGNLLTITSPGNGAVSSSVTTIGYTSDGTYSQNEMLNKPITFIDNLGNTTHIRYDSQGRPVSMWDPAGNEIDYTYNLAAQRLTTIFAATGQSGTGRGYLSETYLYAGGPCSNRKTFDESGTLVRQVNFGYGAEGEKLSTTGDSEHQTLVYDASYRRISLSDGNNNPTNYSHNTAGYLSQITYCGYNGSGSSDTVIFEYNSSGQITQRIDGNGVTTNYGYDTAGTLNSISYPATTGLNATFGYDAYGRISSRSDAEGSYSYAFDDRGGLLSVGTIYTGLSSGTISYSYNSDGTRSGMSTPAGNFSYNYDGAGRVTSLTNPGNETSTLTHDANSRIATLTQANGVVASYSFNALGQIIEVLNQLGSSGSATILSQFSGISYDGAGNRAAVSASLPAITGLGGSVSYGYDSKNQLTEETSARGSGISASFGYDGAGNPTVFQNGSRSYNSDNQLTASGFSYDGSGNPTGYNGTSLTFDPEDKMKAAAGLMTAGYTIDGLRAWKKNTGTGVVTYYLYDGNTPVVELDGLGSVVSTNTFGPDGLISRNVVGAGSTFYTFDERGCVAQRLNLAGSVLSSDLYSAFGTLISGGGPTFGFGGKFGYYSDSETGLILCSLRYYDPETGRWLTRDPIGTRGGVNVYSYCGNEPVIRADPAGLAYWSGGCSNMIGPSFAYKDGGWWLSICIGPMDPLCGIQYNFDNVGDNAPSPGWGWVVGVGPAGIGGAFGGPPSGWMGNQRGGGFQVCYTLPQLNGNPCEIQGDPEVGNGMGNIA